MPKIEKDLHTGVPDHQVLLSFNNDSEAENFEAWWSDGGGEQEFGNFLDQQ